MSKEFVFLPAKEKAIVFLIALFHQSYKELMNLITYSRMCITLQDLHDYTGSSFYSPFYSVLYAQFHPKCSRKIPSIETDWLIRF